MPHFFMEMDENRRDASAFTNESQHLAVLFENYLTKHVRNRVLIVFESHQIQVGALSYQDALLHRHPTQCSYDFMR